jgi:hypothetical protein
MARQAQIIPVPVLPFRLTSTRFSMILRGLILGLLPVCERSSIDAIELDHYEESVRYYPQVVLVSGHRRRWNTSNPMRGNV